jgi:hypothetical protein
VLDAGTLVADMLVLADDFTPYKCCIISLTLETWLEGWIKKGGATPDRSRTPAPGPLFKPHVLLQVKSEKSIKTEKDRIKKRKTEKTKRTLKRVIRVTFKRVVSEVCL